ncbi:MAG TPA: prephenate dehydrogenase/arogenate dehydrogenase family protein [Gaiella sp.]|uniref:prephenate dehydrogenase/arogenate dehydrogenase family protein n=1 Tax=Gaiella sp. TaxID=2663207 RepID=UPI002D7E7BB5|nr:prephenate dehydrogenase/arogenate dehydrogenase family protein [Gaiella sp.]HET9288791.1 prephenate dehydrogenase/arogenate dehydrogenase family protein [Gaiella sp.]
MMIERIGVVGTGLIGASAALGAQRAGIPKVVGWDPDAEHLAVAAERGAVEPLDSLAAVVADAALVLVAAPVGELPPVVREVLDRAPEGCTVTDVGSTKGPVCAAAGDDPRFVGGHPICGAETRGPGRASAELFEGATWFITPTAATPPERLRLLHGFVGSLGARPVAIGPEAHDRLVAVTSHLPHVLANVLLNQAGSTRIEGHDPLHGAGGSLRDMTRIGGANPRIWVDIFLDNREALAGALAEQRRLLEQVERALASGDAGFLARWIGEASGHRRRMLATAFTDPGQLHRLRIHISDRPGVLAGIFQALGAERINVEDFELDHVSAERGGTLTMLVTGEEEARRAAELLEHQGYGVVAAPVIEE